MSIPLVFTLPPSNRHEVILLDTSSKPTLKALNKQITATIASSPNCEECAYLFPFFLFHVAEHDATSTCSRR
jgi:hypothetical protein